jgi:surfactin synthase thioesterase subunit
LLGWLADRLSGGPGAAAAGELADQLRTRFAVFSAHFRLLAGYEPVSDAAPVRAPALIVSASDSLNAPAADRWAQLLAGPVTTLRVAGDHYSFLRPPTVTEVAAALLALP